MLSYEPVLLFDLYIGLSSPNSLNKEVIKASRVCPKAQEYTLINPRVHGLS